MSLVAVPPMELLPTSDFHAQGVNNAAIDASGERYAFVFDIPKTGNIVEVLVRINSVSSAQPMTFSFQTVDGSGLPSGSNYGGSAAGSLATPAAGTVAVALGTAAAGTRGEKVAVVMEFTSAIGNVNLGVTNAPAAGNAYIVFYNGTSWTIQSFVGLVTLKYDDGTYLTPARCMHAGELTSVGFIATTNPDERGLLFRVPTPRRFCAATFVGQLTTVATSTCDLNLFAADGSTVLSSRSIDPDQTSKPIGRYTFEMPTVDLSADVDYYLALLATGAGTVNLRETRVLNAGQLQFGIGAVNYLATRNNSSGSWTLTPTTLPLITPVFDRMEAGGGGSSIYTRRTHILGA